MAKGLITTLLRNKEIYNIIIETANIYSELVNTVVSIVCKELYNL